MTWLIHSYNSTTPDKPVQIVSEDEVDFSSLILSFFSFSSILLLKGFNSEGKVYDLIWWRWFESIEEQAKDIGNWFASFFL